VLKQGLYISKYFKCKYTSRNISVMGIRYFYGPTNFNIKLIICVKIILTSLFLELLFAEQYFISRPMDGIQLLLHICYCSFIRHKYCSIYRDRRNAAGRDIRLWSRSGVM
jgi:hypothetical protein